MAARDLAVIIVTWNVKYLVLDALRSLYADLAESGLDAEVHVVDSASSDGTVEAIRATYPQTHVFASEENLGFARGNNVAIQQVMAQEEPPRAIYLLNPDTITQPGATRTLFDVLQGDPEAGLVGAALRFGDGSFQHSAFGFPGLRQLWVEFFPTPGRFIEGPFNGRYPREDYAGTQPFEVDFTLGATMMLKREAVALTQGFDEDFFMYCEEIDWAWRLREAGWKVLCVPTAQVVHLGGQSTGQVRPRSIINLWESRLKLFRKHYPAWKRWLARGLIAIGVRRKIAEAERNKNLSAADRVALVAAYRTVIHRARHGIEAANT